MNELVVDSDSDSYSDSEEDFEDPLSGGTTVENSKKPRFPVNEDLNSKISLWYGTLPFLCFLLILIPSFAHCKLSPCY